MRRTNPTSDGNSDRELLARREVLRRAALLLGGALGASSVAGVLNGCMADAFAEGADPKALTPAQLAMVAAIVDHVIPPTDTPGARAAGVHRFIDVMLAQYYNAAERSRFLDGLADVNARARRDLGKIFLRATSTQQRQLLADLDREAFPPRAGATVAAGEASRETERGGGGLTQAAAVDSSGTQPRDRTRAPGPAFMRTIKELTVLGYYTSKIGATQELRYVQVPGRFDGCVEFSTVGRAWA